MLMRDWLAAWRSCGKRGRASLRRWGVETLETRTLLSGSPVLVKDINATLITSPGSIGERVYVNGTLYFTVSTPTTGAELWKSDGTAVGTVLVKDILPGPTGSGIGNLTNVNGTLFFSATDGVSGTELWKSDGTEAGTVRVKDLLAGTNGSSPSSFISYNGMLYFSGYSPGKGDELFKSDGTEAGTVLVKDIEAGIFSSTPSKLTIVNGLLYFTAYTSFYGYELWRSDGTEAGTELVKNIYTLPGGNSSTSPSNLTNVNGTLFFTANDGTNGVELWKSDGTDAGTVIVEDILPGSGTSSPSLLTNVNGKLFFLASDGINGAELWTSDGTEAGTMLVKNLTAGATGSTLSNLVSFNNQLYFAAQTGAGGTKLWRSDGTDAGTVTVNASTMGNVSNFLKIGNTLFLRASDTTGGEELWSSDGSDAGTLRVKDIRPGASSSNPTQLVDVNGTLFFQATSGSTGVQLWKSDGTDGGTVQVRSFFDGTKDSNPTEFVTIGGITYFTADDGTSGRELWKTDGTAAGTVRVKDIYVGVSTSDPKSLVEMNGILYFSAFGSGSGYELWRSDGTDAGTYRVKDIATGSSSSSPTLLTNVNGTLYFQATDGTSGVELWRSDGTEAGTVRVKDINATGNSDPRRFVFLNGAVYFTATDGTTGAELWKTDGTEAGTTRVRDINPGTSGSVITKLVVVGNTLYFGATDTTHGWELWKSDGTEAGTVMVKDIYASGTVASEVDELTNLNGTLYFRARGTNSRTEIWKSDGTEAGTVPVTNIGYSTSSSNISNLTNVNGTLYFLSTDTEHGKELWGLDPTGVFLVKDILPGSASASISDMTSLGGILYFATNDFRSGNELWRSDGTTAGTFAIDAVLPGGATPQNLRVAENKLIYSALSDAFGRELYVYDPTPGGAPAPEVQVTWQASDLADGTGVLDFGNIQQGATAIRTIKVRNSGTANLVLQPATVPVGFSLLSNFTPGQIVAPGEFATLTIQLDTATIADRSGQLSFATNDADESPFNFSLSASVNTPLVFITPLGPTSLNESHTGLVEVTVTRTYVSDISQAIFVNLSSDNAGAIQPFLGVWIEANQTSGTTRLYVTNDGNVDGTQTALVTPSEPGFRSQGVSYSVANDDTAGAKTLGGYLSGTIPAETYQVLQELQIADGQTMTIAPGATLRFNSGIGISASGKLLAQGTAAQPIIFTSDNSSPSPGDWSGIQINSDTGTQNILDNVDVSYATSGIQVYSGGGGGVGVATITNSNIHHNRFGIDVEGYNSSAYATIVNNSIHHNVLAGINVYSEGTSTQSSEDGYASVTIERNEINNNGIGVEVSSEGSAAFYNTGHIPDADTFATVKHNWIHHNSTGISASSHAYSGIGIADAFVSLTAYRNVISDNLTRGVHLIVSESGGFLSTLVNNTIINNGQEGVRQFLAESNDLTFKNNLVSGNLGGGVVSTAGSWTPAAELIGYNDVYGNTTGNWIGYPANFGNNTTTNSKGTPSDNEFNISVDPLLAPGDYHLTNVSPLIDAGVSVAGAPTTDIDGNPINGVTDIGADEALLMSFTGGSVAENSLSGTTVGTLGVSDPGMMAGTTYQLVDSGSYPDNTKFAISGATLKTAVMFNFEAKGSYQIKVRAIPPKGPAIDQLLTIQVSDANEAPVLNAAGSPTFTSIVEDVFPASNSGLLVSELISRMSPLGSISDVDAGAVKGIAVIGANQSAGTWQFSINGGTTWLPFGATATSSALLLASNSLTKIRFVPKTNFNGTAGITFTAWDQTSGSNGDWASASVRGGGTAFSVGKEDAFITVTPTADAPVLNAAGNPTLDAIAEDVALASNPGTLVSQIIQRMGPTGGISDPDGVSPQGIGIIGANQNSGTWQYSTNGGTIWSNFGTLSTSSALVLASNSTTRIRFVPKTNFQGTVGITFVAWDPTGGTNGAKVNAGVRGGATAFSTSKENAYITVTPTNDAPTLNNAGSPTLDALPRHIPDVLNGGLLISDLIARMSPLGGIGDIDPGALRGIAIIGANQNIGLWEYSTNNGTSWSGIGSTSSSNALLLAANSTTRIRFKPNINFSGTVGFTFVAWDQTTGTNGTKVNPGGRGGTTAFSTTNESAYVTVT